MKTRVDVRVTAQEKAAISNLARKYDMSINEYVKYLLFYQNNDILDNEFVYHSPSSDKYNFVLLGTAMRTHYMTLRVLEKLCGTEEAKKLDHTCFTKAMEVLENVYGYKKYKNNKSSEN
jgi:hypothetical protein